MSTSVDMVLTMATSAPQGMGFTISKRMAGEIIARFGLQLERRRLDLFDERSALFTFNNEELRLKSLRRGATWRLFKGEWKPDPHWAGD